MWRREARLARRTGCDIHEGSIAEGDQGFKWIPVIQKVQEYVKLSLNETIPTPHNVTR